MTGDLEEEQYLTGAVGESWLKLGCFALRYTHGLSPSRPVLNAVSHVLHFAEIMCMLVKDYVDAKYGVGATTMLSCEAKALGIPYPLPKGWMSSYALSEISIDAAKRLRVALEKSGKESAKKGIDVLDKAWIELKTIPDVNGVDFLKSKAWKRLRYQALKLNGNKCQSCGTDSNLNVDHIKPRRLHPELALHITNLQVLCAECNEGKSNWDMTDFRNGRTKQHGG